MKRVALLIETSRAYGRDILLGVHRYLAEHGPWSVFVELRDLESRPPVWLKRWNGDGILARTGSPAVAATVRAAGVPTVELRSTRLNPDFPFVGINNEAVGRLGAEHLLQLGYRHFGVYQLTTEHFFEERRDSFIATLAQHGHDCQALQQSGNREKPAQWERQQASLMNWLRQLPKPAAVFACTDQLGFWLLDACGRAKLSVPDEVAVIGVENDETLCAMSSPPLTSIALGGERIGYAAAATLDQLMRGRTNVRRHQLLEPLGVIARQSTDTVAVSDPLLAAALRLVRTRATLGLRVSEILAQVPLSRSSLERGFRALLGRSPNAEILRVRLNRARELLLDTDLNLQQIAERTAFTHAHYFSHCFQRHYGQTPGQFRKLARGR